MDPHCTKAYWRRAQAWIQRGDLDKGVCVRVCVCARVRVRARACVCLCLPIQPSGNLDKRAGARVYA